MKRTMLALVVILAPFFGVKAQSPNVSLLNWVAPTTYTDGTAITEAITYNVYFGTTATGILTQVASGLTGTTYTDSQAALTAGSTACYAVTAVTPLAGESAYSAVACKTFPHAKPNPPTNTLVK